MRKKILIVEITFLLFTVGLSGCQVPKSTEKLVTEEVNTFAPGLEDLPEGYIIWSENRNQSGGLLDIIFLIENIIPEEVYRVTFIFTNPDSIAYPGIALSISKFNSSDQANVALYNYSEQISNSVDTFLNWTTPQSVEKIGDSSIYELYKGNLGVNWGYINVTWSFIYFRIKNIVVALLIQGMQEWEIDYVSLTINYAKIIEDKINASL